MSVLKILVGTLFMFLTYDTINYFKKTEIKVENHPLELVRKETKFQEKLPERVSDAIPAVVFSLFLSAFVAVLFVWSVRRWKTVAVPKEQNETHQHAKPEPVEPVKEEKIEDAEDLAPLERRSNERYPVIRLRPRQRTPSGDVDDEEDGLEILELRDSPPSVVPSERKRPETRDASSQINLMPVKEPEVKKPEEPKPINIQVKCECSLMSFQERLDILEKALNQAEASTKSWSQKIEKAELDISELQKQVWQMLSDSQSVVTDSQRVGDGMPVYRCENQDAIQTLSDLIAETKRQRQPQPEAEEDVVSRPQEPPGRGTYTSTEVQEDMVAVAETRTETRETTLGREIEEVMSDLRDGLPPALGLKPQQLQPQAKSSAARFRSVNSRYLMSRTTLISPPGANSGPMAAVAPVQTAKSNIARTRTVSARSPQQPFRNKPNNK